MLRLWTRSTATTGPLASLSSSLLARSLSTTRISFDANQQLLDRIRADVKVAMRAKDKVRLTVLRSLISDVTYAEKSAIMKDATAEPVTPAVVPILRKAISRRTEAAESFKVANSADAAAAEEAEAKIIAEYLPQGPSEQEIEAMVRKAIEATKATSAKETGKVIGAVMKQAKADGNADLLDGKVIGEVVKRLLQ
ncbi:GatB/YqeY domain-containing protein [Ramicandelaber brevisporus]|nr:GatB/YqeY domain-containing protein [Ramicandelaber brevisporus]